MDDPGGSSDEGEMYKLTSLLTNSDIKLCAWSQNGRKELLALYLRSGELVYYYLTDENPVVKQIPWFTDSSHTPVSIALNPSGSFLLVLSELCNLYILPAIPLVDPTVSNDQAFDFSDMTIHTWPFINKPILTKGKTKSPSSNLSVKSSLSRQSSNSSMSSTDNSKRKSSRSSSSSSSSHQNETKTCENLSKLKDIMYSKENMEPVVVVWWQCVLDCQQIAVMGTKSGNIIFVNLNTGLRVGESSVKGQIKSLAICQDNSLDTVYLLITVDNDEQYNLVLEQKQSNYIWPGRQGAGLVDDCGNMEGLTVGRGNYLPTARARLQGLKQLSVEKLANLKQKIAETRSKMKPAVEGTEGKMFGTPTPESLSLVTGDRVLSPQFSHGQHVLAAYHPPSQLLTVRYSPTNAVPLYIHKLPADSEQLLLCDKVVFVTSQYRTCVQVVSANLSETRVEPVSDFNPDCVLGKWDFNKSNGETDSNVTKPDLLPDGVPYSSCERILNTFRSIGKEKMFSLTEEYKVTRSSRDMPDSPPMENCIVVTTRGVYLLGLNMDALRMALHLILRTQELEKAERVCKIFGVNLQQVLELAGDINLAALEFPKAIALYKLSKCGPLKSIVKLACGGHCSQVLSYSTVMLSTSISDMSLTERIHLSNLVLMAYTQQILKADSHDSLQRKFLEFLQNNSYYDEILAVTVTGQSLLFSALHQLISHKGLIDDGYMILLKLLNRFAGSRYSQWTFDTDRFWNCVTDSNLIEAIVCRSNQRGHYLEHVLQHVDTLSPAILQRLLVLFDPTSPCIRPVSRIPWSHGNTDQEESSRTAAFPFHKLVHLYLVALIAYLTKSEEEKVYRRHLLLTQLPEETNVLLPDDIDTSTESLSDQHIWPIRKEKTGNRKRSASEANLSCGFGHCALVRNGNIYTWGQSGRGCLGHGPSMSRHSTPLPVSWLVPFKLEVSRVACGRYHTLALTNNGVYAWGGSQYGQLGLGDVWQSPHPRLVLALANENIVNVKCGQYHTIALSSQGSVFAWGWGVHGQLGLGSVEDKRIPTPVHTLREHVVVDIAAGHGHSLVLSDKGHVYSFGSSVFGQLGTGLSAKSSVPVLVKGIQGRVTLIATGYFQNLALTESHVLYTWGASPQSLRLQSQAHKRSRMLQSQNSPPPGGEGSELDTSIPVEQQPIIEHDSHLSPTVVDTRNVTGKIIHVSSGCHHSALLTDLGHVYTWGRSLDGQLGNGGRREVLLPTLLSCDLIRADVVECGSEYTIVQDKLNGKVFAWGSNSVGQLGLAVKDSATKALDGKLVMVRSCRRVVRIPHAGSNSFDTPQEVPDIPSASFSYQTLNKHTSQEGFSLGAERNTHEALHRVLEKYHWAINTDLLVKKCHDYGNYQAASKIALLQNKIKPSMIHQLKALQNIDKYHVKPGALDATPHPEGNKSEAVTPDSEIHLFTIQGGQEEMCDSPSQDVSRSEDEILDEKGTMELQQEEKVAVHHCDGLREEYMDHAKYIIQSYLDLPAAKGMEALVLETGIQFWTAEKLPMTSLETFFMDMVDSVYYDLGYVLFCQQKKGNQTPLMQHFSPKFLFEITSKILKHVEKNGSCLEYLETMSRIMLTEEEESLDYLGNSSDARDNKLEAKTSNFIELLTEKLTKLAPRDSVMTVQHKDLTGGSSVFFSCGHHFTLEQLDQEVSSLRASYQAVWMTTLLELYSNLKTTGRVDACCPQCVRLCL